MSSKKQFEVLQWAFSFLKKHDREEKVAEILLLHHLGISRTAFFANMRKAIPDPVFRQFEEDVRKHASTGVPVQHLLGYEYFYGRKFHVNEDVLVPRFETEELVQHVIALAQRYFADGPIAIADAGTGSGVIAITLALELPNATVHATDVSEKALDVAVENARLHEASVEFLQGDFLQPIIDMAANPELIISNPPYIDRKEKESLADTVKQFDPELALFADDNGLQAYKKIIAQIKALPAISNRHVCFEIGHMQAKAVASILERELAPRKIDTMKDINGKDRIISASL